MPLRSCAWPGRPDKPPQGRRPGVSGGNTAAMEGEAEARKSLRGPKTIIWLLTARCNLKCPWCYAARFSKWGAELGTAEALGLIREAAAVGVRYLGLSGGEVSLRPDLPQLVRAASASGMSVGLVTNGTLLTEALLAELAACRVHVFLSVDGVCRETHESIRGPGTWEKVLAAARMMTRRGIRFSAVFAVGRANYREAPAFVGLVRELGAAGACLIPVMPAGRATAELVLGTPEMVEVLEGVEGSAEELGFPVSLWCVPFAGLVTRSPRVRFFACRSAGAEMDIAPNGEVLLCDVLDLSLGNVRGGLIPAWEKQQKSEVVRALARPPRSGPCISCPERNRCRGGCFARAFLATGDLYAPDPLCPRVAGACGNRTHPGPL